MECNGHFWMHCLGIVVFGILNAIIHIIESGNIWVYYLKLLGTFFIINPDIDIVLSKIKIKLWKWEWRLNLFGHRSFWTHSVILPLLVYWLFRDFVNFGADMEALALLVFFAPLVHLIADLKPHAVIETLIEDAIEKRKKKGKYSEGSAEVGGTWQYSFLPITDNRLNYKATASLMVANIVGMIVLVIIL